LAAISLPSIVQGQEALIWSDEFDGATLDTATWEPMIGDGTAYGISGWGNNELEYYTARPENLFVSGGFLHIVAREESFAGFDYTSARLRTLNNQDFRYGRLEARIQLPVGQGIWPAFWMLPTGSPYGGWAASGEIDIMESVNAMTTLHGTLHFGDAWPANASAGGTYVPGAPLSQAFHVYGIEWEPDEIRWYYDGLHYHTQTSASWYSAAAPGNPRAPFDQDFHFLLNVAVGGNWPGNPNGSTVFPQEMLVDWVRVSDLTADPNDQTPFLGFAHGIPGQIEAEDYDLGGEGLAYHDCDTANNGGAYRPGEGVDVEPSSEGAFDVGWTCQGEWIEYTVNVAAAGTYQIDARVASLATGGSFRLEFDGVDQTGVVSVPATGGWQSWTTVTATATLLAGEQIMRYVNLGSASDEFNINGFSLCALPAADTNGDGSVDITDLGTLLANFGTTSGATLSDGDVNGDGAVSITDLGTLLAEFGMTC
jgi:beta-glucanase (GH16 family)